MGVGGVCSVWNYGWSVVNFWMLGSCSRSFAMWSDKMASRKQASWSVSEASSSDGAGQPLKGGCYWPNKWITEYDKELNSSAWLKYTIINHFYVDTLTCSICAYFRSKLEGMHNYNPAYIEGPRNLRMSSIKDHAARTMHVWAISLHLAKIKHLSKSQLGHHSILNSCTAVCVGMDVGVGVGVSVEVLGCSVDVGVMWV